ncbi:hypothetical protein LIER_21784 [Lithospermum erythrorhizon]|uniref:DUF641 domain-containing protein n=1 Tax=Lithospermum erythrorhizon TaxID=34254 RepID=A0AAV3QT06_LITER
MNSDKRSSSTPVKSRLASAFAKVLHLRPDKLEVKKDVELKDYNSKDVLVFSNDEEKIKNELIIEAFLAKMFASVSAIKAAYATLQQAQCPYNPEGIQFADDLIEEELKNLAEMRQCFLKKQFDENSPETALAIAEIQEMKHLVKMYEISGKKLDYQVKLKESEVTFLKEKLQEEKKENELLETRMDSSGLLPRLENLNLSTLGHDHFIAFHKRTVKSIRSFVRLLVNKLESAEWDLEAAVSIIEPNVVLWKSSHGSYAFESFVCKEMFERFNDNYFSNSMEASSKTNVERRPKEFFARFMELKSVKATDYLVWKPKSVFARFCREKYFKLMHPKMEESLFGNLDQRNQVKSSEYPETPFFSAFAEMAKRVWLLHCLAFSFHSEASVFQVSQGSRFSELYMVGVNDEPFIISPHDTEDTQPRVAFTVIPGFRFSSTIVQCQVYLR